MVSSVMNCRFFVYLSKMDHRGVGHYCKICGRTRPNEKFSGKGHRNHVCKDCSRRKVKKSSNHEDEISPEMKSLFDTLPPRMQDIYGDHSMFAIDFEKCETDEEDDEDLPF